jgi:hypothetical protein
LHSGGLPSVVDAGTINPRAPRLVCSVTSAIWATYPNSSTYADIRIAEPVPIPRLCRADARAGGDRPGLVRVLRCENGCVVGIVTGPRGRRAACRAACSGRA